MSSAALGEFINAMEKPIFYLCSLRCVIGAYDRWSLGGDRNAKNEVARVLHIWRGLYVF